MKVISHQKVSMEDMNHHGSTEAKRLTAWLIDAAYMGVAQTFGRTDHIVMCSVKELAFEKPVFLGTILTLSYELVKVGKSSLTVSVEACDMLNKEKRYACCQVVFVNVDDNGKGVPHGISVS